MLKLILVFIISSLIACAPTKSYKRSPTTTSTTKSRYYIVKKGDSLWGISQRYSVSVKDLMRQNKISSADNLIIGKKIIIPLDTRIGKGTMYWPVEGKIINFFNETIDNSPNKGINIKVSSNNNLVSASEKGKVVFANVLKGWGKTIILKHEKNLYTIYANLDKTLINEGSFAKRGQTIGKLASQRKGSCMLHFEVRKRYIPDNPLKYLN